METAKECVTTHLPNQLALKMDGARASGPYSTATDYARRQVVAIRRVAMVSVEGVERRLARSRHRRRSWW